MKEWRVISGAPIIIFTFAVVIAVTAGILWEARYADRIETLNQRIQFANEQLSEYREQLRGATPTEAAERLAELERKLDKEAARNPTSAVLNRREVEQQDGSIRIEEDFFVGGSAFIPVGLNIEVRSESRIRSVHITNANFSRVERRCVMSPGPCADDHTWTYMIPRPQGMYTIIVITEGMENTNIAYSFHTEETSQTGR